MSTEKEEKGKNEEVGTTLENCPLVYMPRSLRWCSRNEQTSLFTLKEICFFHSFLIFLPLFEGHNNVGIYMWVKA